jgi:hypothetical protein
MKQPKLADPFSQTFPEEACASTAIEGLCNGHERPMGQYARALGDVLRNLSDQFSPGEKNQPLWRFQSPRSPKPRSVKPSPAGPGGADEEWEGTPDEIGDAIQDGDTQLIGTYLRDAADVLGLVGDALDPQDRRKRWQLEFFLKGLKSKRWPSSTIDALVAEETRKAAGQKESAVAQVSRDTGLSRATIFRRQQKARSSSESHKKR